MPPLPPTPEIDRPLGSAENIYWLLDRLYGLNFVVFAEVKGELDEDRLAPALSAVQSEHPLLRARVATVRTRRWFKPVPVTDAPLELQVFNLEHFHEEMERQVQLPFDTARGPLARCLWFKGEGESVLAITFLHAIADGRSGLSLLVDVLRRAADPTLPLTPRTPQRSSQSLDPIRTLHPVRGATKRAKFWITRLLEAARGAQQLPGYDQSAGRRRQIRMMRYELEPAELRALQHQARRQGTTVNGTLGAAKLLAIAQQLPGGGPHRVGLTSLADLRPHLSGDLSERDLGLYVATLSSAHKVRGPGHFWALAREVRETLTTRLGAGEGNLLHDVYPGPLALPPSRAVARGLQKVVTLSPASPMLSNVGRLGSVELGHGLHLTSLAFAISPPLHHPVSVAAATYGGRMILHLTYDELKVGTGTARKIGDAMMAELRQATRPY